ncbi:hypothetical protein LTR08_008225 [Meristemomyces frigidus]|nr:hypothetical protein LTR08_008225 [Meristemomyces frigidus]
MRTAGIAAATTAALLLGALPLVCGHENQTLHPTPFVEKLDPPDVLWPSYFRHGQYGGWMLAHILCMILAWVIVLPVALVLSSARSRYHLPAQVVFHTINGLGVFTSIIYDNATPDLYEHNAHHLIGWIVNSLTFVWTFASLYAEYGRYKSKKQGGAQNRSAVSQSRAHGYSDQSTRRWSRDSGVGSSRLDSSESILQKVEEPQSPEHDVGHGDEEEDDESERRGFLGNHKADRFISRHVRCFKAPGISTVIRVLQIFLEKLLLLLGFAAILSGFVVYGGIARHWQIFSIAAHFVKGGIFFWYGVLTLGRWMGAFTEFGWAWNIRPDYPLVARWKSRVPSAEFTESFVIWFYGASNVFLEHLVDYGEGWTPEDFEHLSITVLFFGGGLLGMLIESNWARELTNTTVVMQQQKDVELTGTARTSAPLPAEDPAAQLWREPTTYKTSTNPMPALVIMILGIVMSAHPQKSMVSTMLHKQWGTLFGGFAIARAFTYIIMYLKPPTSHYPARPPTELAAAFCLTSGGLLFMASAHDTVWAIESNGLGAITIFAVTMGLTGIIMAWEIVAFAIKGWAVRKEAYAAGKLSS